MSITDEYESLSPRLRQDFVARLGKGRKQLMWIGIALIVCGVLALLFPLVSTLTTAIVIGWFFLFGGVIGMVHSFTIHGTGPFFGAFLTSLLAIGLSIYMLANPGTAVFALTVMAAVYFMVEGAFSVTMALEMRPHQGWGWMMFSAIVSIFLGGWIIFQLPAASLFVLGIVVGVNFLSSGIAAVMLSRVVAKAV